MRDYHNGGSTKRRKIQSEASNQKKSSNHKVPFYMSRRDDAFGSLSRVVCFDVLMDILSEYSGLEGNFKLALTSHHALSEMVELYSLFYRRLLQKNFTHLASRGLLKQDESFSRNFFYRVARGHPVEKKLMNYFVLPNGESPSEKLDNFRKILDGALLDEKKSFRDKWSITDLLRMLTLGAGVYYQSVEIIKYFSNRLDLSNYCKLKPEYRGFLTTDTFRFEMRSIAESRESLPGDAWKGALNKPLGPYVKDSISRLYYSDTLWEGEVPHEQDRFLLSNILLPAFSKLKYLNAKNLYPKAIIEWLGGKAEVDGDPTRMRVESSIASISRNIEEMELSISVIYNALQRCRSFFQLLTCCPNLTSFKLLIDDPDLSIDGEYEEHHTELLDEVLRILRGSLNNLQTLVLPFFYHRESLTRLYQERACLIELAFLELAFDSTISEDSWYETLQTIVDIIGECKKIKSLTIRWVGLNEEECEEGEIPSRKEEFLLLIEALAQTITDSNLLRRLTIEHPYEAEEIGDEITKRLVFNSGDGVDICLVGGSQTVFFKIIRPTTTNGAYTNNRSVLFGSGSNQGSNIPTSVDGSAKTAIHRPC